MTPRILVVDDEPDIRAIVRIALETLAGWTVLEAPGGEAGLDLARQERPDAVLLDVMMPGLDGPATARRLAADPATADIPVVMLTAKVLSSERAALAQGPVAAVLSKPFDPLTLAADVRAALGWTEGSTP
ncbi:MAG: response regulator [Kineosporiaceae bacterium]